MAVLYGPYFRKIWTAALCLPGLEDPFESLAVELSEFLGVTVDEAKVRMEGAWQNRAESARAGLPADKDSASLRAYYAVQEHGLFVSSYWHSLRPDSWALHGVAALTDCMQFAEGNCVFEFGHGIGSTGLLFAAHGFRMTMGDVSPAYRDFARYRFRRRGLNADFIDVSSEEPRPATFDAVVSLDVLEHIPTPIRELRRLHAALKPGGVLLLNVVFGRDPSNPEHILHRRIGVLDRFRGVGFERLPSTLLAYYKRPLGLARRALYRLQDILDAASLDLATRKMPLLWRLTHVMVPPDRLA
jgi:mycofactocin glycosyltransferase